MEGPPFVNHSELQEDFGVVPVIYVSGVATTGANVGGTTEYSVSSGGFESANPATSIYLCYSIEHLPLLLHPCTYSAATLGLYL